MIALRQISDSLARSSWRARPRSFVALMSLYESNYLRLAVLVGDLRTIDEPQISRLAGDCDLVLTPLEHCVYTTTLNLTYQLDDAPAQADPAAARVPDLTIRAYRDARLAEALSISGIPFVGLAAERELEHRWARNMVLNKWLDYCTECGHRFPGAPPGV
jgi:uncharacterized protein YqiB (DUF1249 family)